MSRLTLQINLAPGDIRYCHALLPHHLRVFREAVDEILLTYDTRKGKGRFAIDWESNHEKMSTFLKSFAAETPGIRIENVDDSPDTRRRVSEAFFTSGLIPNKDFRGGPFYSYFFGLFSARFEHILHIDSDMFFGGNATTWVKEALELMENRTDVLFTGPLPGPPHPDALLFGQATARAAGGESMTFEFSDMSTRVFLVDRGRLMAEKLSFGRPSAREMIKAYLGGNQLADLPERLISRHMMRRGLKRVDFLGSTPGLWSLHPPYRTDGFYADLDSLVERIERADIPENQRGFYDMTDSMCDWTQARTRLRDNAWWRRSLRRVGHSARKLSGRSSADA